MKMAATMSSQRKRKRSEKQDNTGRHQLYDWTNGWYNILTPRGGVDI